MGVRPNQYVGSSFPFLLLPPPFFWAFEQHNERGYLAAPLIGYLLLGKNLKS